MCICGNIQDHKRHAATWVVTKMFVYFSFKELFNFKVMLPQGWLLKMFVQCESCFLHQFMSFYSMKLKLCHLVGHVSKNYVW